MAWRHLEESQAGRAESLRRFTILRQALITLSVITGWRFIIGKERKGEERRCDRAGSLARIPKRYHIHGVLVYTYERAFGVELAPYGWLVGCLVGLGLYCCLKCVRWIGRIVFAIGIRNGRGRKGGGLRGRMIGVEREGARV
jgi:hypothetical protein